MRGNWRGLHAKCERSNKNVLKLGWTCRPIVKEGPNP